MTPCISPDTKQIGFYLHFILLHKKNELKDRSITLPSPLTFIMDSFQAAPRQPRVSFKVVPFPPAFFRALQ